MIYITRVKVESLNRSCLNDTERKSALERACARARSIKRGDRAIRSAQDAVIHIARVKRTSRDRPCGVKAKAGKNKGALAGACARVRSIKRIDRTVRSAQEAVSHIASVNVASRDRLRRVDVAGKGTLAGTCARARDVEGSDGTVRSAQEAVKHTARVVVVARARACRVDTEGPSALAGACARARSVERDDGAVRSAQDSVNRTARVGVASRDRPCRVDSERDCALAGACARARSVECGDGRLRVNEGRVAEFQEAIARAPGRTGRKGAWGGIGRSRRLRQRKTGEENGSKEQSAR